MATYFRGFEEADGISDFTEVPTAAGNDAPAWSIVNTNELQATSASSHNELLAWNDIDGDANRADVELLFQYYNDSATASQRVAGVRMATSGTRTGYAVRVRTNSIDTYRFTGLTFTAITNSAVSFSSGTWCWVRFRVNGTTVRARIWADGDSEPGTWDCDSTDSTYSTAGHVGPLKGANTNTQKWRKFGVGTNGDTAPSSGGGGAAALEGSVSAAATVAAGLTTAIQCAASVSGTAATSAALTTAIQCAASVSGSASVSASLTTAIRCAASVNATATVSASLAGGAAALEASASGAATVAAGLTTAIRCAASVSGSASVSASLTTGSGGVAADVSCSATVAAALTTAIRCAAGVQGTASVSASLAGAAAALQASASASATVNATLTGSAAQLAAAAIAQAQATAALSTVIRMAASLQLSATQSASLTAGPLDVFVREPHPFTLHGVPRERMVRLDKPARQIGALLKGQ